MRAYHMTKAECDFVVRTLRVVASWDQNILKRLAGKEAPTPSHIRETEQRIGEALRLAELIDEADMIDLWPVRR